MPLTWRQRNTLTHYLTHLEQAGADECEENCELLSMDRLEDFTDKLSLVREASRNLWLQIDFHCPFLASRTIDCEDHKTCKGCPIKAGCSMWGDIKRIIDMLDNIMIVYHEAAERALRRKTRLQTLIKEGLI